MRKFIITAEMRDLEEQLYLENISYSRMIELLNEKADKWFEDKLQEDIHKINEILVEAIKKAKIRVPNFNKGGVVNNISDNLFISGGECVVPFNKKGSIPYDNEQYMFKD